MEQKSRTRKFGAADRFGYFLGDFGNNILNVIVGSYLLVYCTKVLGISAGVVGVILMASRFFDAFTDFGMGRISDSYQDKKGERYRVWILRFCVPIVLSVILLYHPWVAEQSMAAKIAYVSLMYVIYGSVCFTAINIPYGAMINAISDDPVERSSLSKYRTYGGLVAQVVVMMAIPALAYTKDAAGNTLVAKNGFLTCAIVLGAITLVSYLGCYFGCKERIKGTAQPAKEQEKKSGGLKESVAVLAEICKDPCLLGMIVASIMVSAVATIFATLLPYVAIDYFNAPWIQSVGGLAMIVGAIIITPFANKITTRFGKKEGSVAGLTVCGVFFVLALLVPRTQPVLFAVMLILAFAGFGYFYLVMFALIADAIDHHYALTGKKNEGTIYGVYSFLRKLAGAVTGSIGAWSLAAIGYDSLATVQTASVQTAVFRIGVLIPACLFAIAAVCLAFLCPLNSKAIAADRAKIAEMEATKE